MKSATIARKLSIIVLFLAAGGYAGAAVKARVQYPQSHVLCLDRTIMVDTPLELVLCSDANSLWSGGLFVAGNDRGRGTLWGRDDDPNEPEVEASCLPAAGRYARVLKWRDSYMWGYDAYASDDSTRAAGDWFVVDYTADDLGDCTVGFYQHSMGWNTPDPNRSIEFTHVPSRDFDKNGNVALSDFVGFAAAWQSLGCSGTAACAEYDYDGDADVDLEDLAAFTEFWLWGTPGWPADVLYAVVDGSGRSEITAEVGTTLTLYVDLTNIKGTVQVFSTEVVLSNSDLGSIDNRSYDPANPGSSTARVVASPSHAFDVCEPGFTDPNGIRFSAGCFEGPFLEGHLARFEYTVLAPGDVTLQPTSDAAWHRAVLQPLIIHQVDPNQVQSRLDRDPAATAIDPYELAAANSDAHRRYADTVRFTRQHIGRALGVALDPMRRGGQRTVLL